MNPIIAEIERDATTLLPGGTRVPMHSHDRRRFDHFVEF